MQSPQLILGKLARITLKHEKSASIGLRSRLAQSSDAKKKVSVNNLMKWFNSKLSYEHLQVNEGLSMRLV